LLGLQIDVTEKVRAEEEIRLLNERLRLLAVAVQELAAARGLPDVTEVVRRTARWLVGADGVTFVLRDGDQCHYVEEDAIGPLWKGMRFPLEECISGWVILHGEAAVIEDIYADPRIPHDAYRSTFVQSLAMVPIRREEPIGAIGAYWAERRRPTDDEVAILQALADATSRAVESVRLYEELERRVQERTAELNASNKELESFSYSVSHDLRAPLRAIDGFSRAVDEDYGERLDDEGRRLLGIIRSSTRQMGQLIDDLLDFSRAGRHELRRGPADMTALARLAFEGLAGAQPDPGVTFHLAPLEDATGDPSLLKQVWVNLMSNALKFSAGRTPSVIEVGGRRDGAQLVYWVRDNGVGFDDRYAHKLFGVFQRLHAAGEFPGTGVGLAIVKRIVTRHGGAVWAESRLEKGATFFFSLPETKGEFDEGL
jgi:signal transduction histidine kinase